MSIMNVFWLLLIFSSSFTLAEDYEKCLVDKPEVFPRKYFHLRSKSLFINLEMSSRLSHQISTHIYYIFLKEVLGYSKVQIKMVEDDFQVEPVIASLSDYYNPKIIEPLGTVNLEVWIPPDYNKPNITQLVEFCGKSAPPGRFGWFIPRQLSHPVNLFYEKHKTRDYYHDVHWSIFTDPELAGLFDIPEEFMEFVIQRDSKIKVNRTEQYVCNNASVCDRGMYIPKQCKDQPCATLLAPHYHNISSFLVDQIEEMQLLVKVVWLGNKLKSVIQELTSIHLLEEGPRGPKKSVVFFGWYPSDIVYDQQKFIPVLFPNNEMLNFTKTDIGYKYELHRIVKMAWSKIVKLAIPLYNSLTFFSLTEDDYKYVFNLHEEHPTMTPRDIACSWMRNNEYTYLVWRRGTTTPIYIGGIFPLQAASYNGKGIVSGAYMAQFAINQDPSLLKGYTLQLLVTDGKCQADNVMKSFIDFIVKGYYPQLVGVLGPACSETVEPLAGVSKHYHIMVISYSAEGASFSDRDKYPYFFRTIGENKHYKEVYLKLFQFYNWTRLAALTEDGQKYTEYISLMQDDMQKNNITFIANKKFPRERDPDAMKTYLEDLKNKRARIIIADVVDDVARSVMCDAYKLNMTAAYGYVWFLPVWLNSTWYNTDFFNTNKSEMVNCTTDEMVKAINGYFTMTHSFWAPDNATMQEHMTVGEWRRLYTQKTKDPSDYAGFAYDAVWTYALALDKLSKSDPEALSDLHSENTTNKLVKLVEATDFQGVSGRIKFRGGPSRFSVIELKQWYDNEMHTIGHFYPNLSDDKPEILGGDLKLNTSAVRWFTPDKQVPGDGTLPPPVCALDFIVRWFNVECSSAYIIFNGTVGVIVLLLVIGVILFMKWRYDKKVQETKNYIRSLGLPFDMNNTTDLDKWEVSRESVVINRKLGQGAFGTVYGGEANLMDTGWCAVAVKTLKLGSTTEEKLDFLSEAEVMKRFDHKNIIKLLGVCTKDEPIYTIMEFMLYGDLKTYLLARRNLVSRSAEESDEISPRRLTSMALDVARGLSYLAEMKYVHRDVASRNCLVNAQRVVKLGDFGMTRAMFENDYYKFTRKGMLPVRWMSPESLEMGVFTTSSDVWSYGVLLFEIITFGSFPFQGKSNAQVLELVKAGHTVEIPKGLKPQLEGLIKSCWDRDSKKRPAASEIVEFLANNPRLLTPCLDGPMASVQLEDSDEAEIIVPAEFRKCTPSKTSPGKSTVAIPLMRIYPSANDSEQEAGSSTEQACSKEPLLGTAKPTSSSLLSLGKLVTRSQKKEVDAESGLPHSQPGPSKDKGKEA